MNIVAEISGNHLGNFDRACELIDAAVAAKADAVKLQTFTPEQMAEPGIIQAGPWKGVDLLELYRETHTPRAWHKPLFEYARELGIEIFSSVFHPDDVDFLERLDCPRYKISSFELTDHDLIRHAAKTGKPMVISTGMACEAEIAAAVGAAAGCAELTLLKCTSAYPADASDANLMTMPSMGRRFSCYAGLSDHSEGIGVAIAAAVFSASMIEKHLTLSRKDGGPDAEFSLEPQEFRQMVTECRRAVEAIGEIRYGPTESEKAHLSLRRPPGGKRAA